jgi:Ca2+:H+ antiporter
VTLSDKRVIALAALLCAVAGVLRYATSAEVATFILSGAALAVLASLVGRSVDQIADRLGAGATGVLQSALGNLPELFVAIFALRAGLVEVVQAAIVGSILGNLLLVLGAAFVVGGLRHGTQRFDASRARTLNAQLLLAVAALLVPSLAHYVHSPAAAHERVLSVITAVVLLVVFAASVPASVRRTPDEQGTMAGTTAGESREADEQTQRWSTAFAVGMLAATGGLAAFVSDWFVHALQPSLITLHISQAFAGLVIVAIAGNAVENFVGIQLAARNRADHTLSVVLNSPLQIALVLAPLLVLISPLIGAHDFTLAFPPLLVTTVVAAVIAVAFVIVDGESEWLEGAALLGLYAVVATSFWWG